MKIEVSIVKFKAGKKKFKFNIGSQGSRTQAADSPAIHSYTELHPHRQADAHLAEKNLSLENTWLSSLYQFQSSMSNFSLFINFFAKSISGEA